MINSLNHLFWRTPIYGNPLIWPIQFQQLPQVIATCWCFSSCCRISSANAAWRLGKSWDHVATGASSRDFNQYNSWLTWLTPLVQKLSKQIHQGHWNVFFRNFTRLKKCNHWTSTFLIMMDSTLRDLLGFEADREAFLIDQALHLAMA